MINCIKHFQRLPDRRTIGSNAICTDSLLSMTFNMVSIVFNKPMAVIARSSPVSPFSTTWLEEQEHFQRQGSVAKRKNLREASALLSRSKYIFREKAHEKVYSLPGNVFRKRLREASALFPVLLQKRVKCTCFAKEVHLLREDGFFLQQTSGVDFEFKFYCFVDNLSVIYVHIHTCDTNN